MRSWEALPRLFLPPAGPLTADLKMHDITDFRAAGHYLQSLPYGRTKNRSDFSAILREGKGTCSTKHAYLAALAQEHRLPVVLTLGIYDMHERNTPGVGVVLRRYGLASIPEAHCYVTYEDMRIDITRSGTEPAEPITQFLYEEMIVPEQIGSYKETLHRQVIQDWVRHHMIGTGGQSAAEIWRIREACIAALSQ